MTPCRASTLPAGKYCISLLVLHKYGVVHRCPGACMGSMQCWPGLGLLYMCL